MSLSTLVFSVPPRVLPFFLISSARSPSLSYAAATWEVIPPRSTFVNEISAARLSETSRRCSSTISTFAPLDRLTVRRPDFPTRVTPRRPTNRVVIRRHPCSPTVRINFRAITRGSLETSSNGDPHRASLIKSTSLVLFFNIAKEKGGKERERERGNSLTSEGESLLRVMHNDGDIN